MPEASLINIQSETNNISGTRLQPLPAVINQHRIKHQPTNKEVCKKTGKKQESSYTANAQGEIIPPLVYFVFKHFGHFWGECEGRKMTG